MNIYKSAASLALIFIIIISGCNESASTGAQGSSSIEPDPRFITLESTLAYYNSISAKDPVDVEAAINFCYPENEFQRRILEISRATLPINDLDRQMFATFNEGWNPKAKKPMTAANLPATLVKGDAQRGEAEYINSVNEKRTAHFVKIGDRWWMSGFTIEYDPDSKDYRQNIDAMERLVPAMADAVPTVLSQLKSGQFKTAQEVRLALMKDVLTKNPALVEDTIGLGAN